jgi:hypothetical protein
MQRCLNTVVAVANLCGPMASPRIGSDLGAGPMNRRRGLHIIGLDAGPCIIEC